MSAASLTEGGAPRTVDRPLLPVRNTRRIGKRDMILNDACPRIDIDSEKYTVTIDGEVVLKRPASELPLTQRYFLF